MTFLCFYILAFIIHSFFNQFSPLFDFQRHVASPAALLYLLVQEKVGPICRRKLVNPVSVRRGFCIKTHSRGDPRSYLSSFWVELKFNQRFFILLLTKFLGCFLVLSLVTDEMKRDYEMWIARRIRTHSTEIQIVLLYIFDKTHTLCSISDGCIR